MPVVMPPTEEQLEQLLLHHKYHTAVRRVARGVAHSYNNIFTGLGGQANMLLQEAALPTTPDDKRGGLINELLQRGIEQTGSPLQLHPRRLRRERPAIAAARRRQGRGPAQHRVAAAPLSPAL
jgi:hypothetical protein